MALKNKTHLVDYFSYCGSQREQIKTGANEHLEIKIHLTASSVYCIPFLQYVSFHQEAGVVLLSFLCDHRGV